MILQGSIFSNLPPPRGGETFSKLALGKKHGQGPGGKKHGQGPGVKGKDQGERLVIHNHRIDYITHHSTL